MRLQFKVACTLGFVICLCLTTASFYFQFALKLTPCLLCVLNRLNVIFLGVLFLFARLQQPKKVGQVIYALIASLTSVAGLLVSIRHIWIQSLPPDKIPNCSPSLEYLLNTFPITEMLSVILSAGGECAKVEWRFLSLSLAGWMFIFSIILTLLSVSLFFAKNNFSKNNKG